MDSDIYYFGCLSKEKLGHCLYAPGRPHPIYEADLPEDFPCRPDILDGGLLPPKGKEIEGEPRIWRTEEWTIVTFWDRSADPRGKCNSAFICRGELCTGEVVFKAERSFPDVVARFTLEVRRRLDLA